MPRRDDTVDCPADYPLLIVFPLTDHPERRNGSAMAFTLVLGAIGLPPSRDFFYTGVTRFPHPRTLKACVA